MRPVHARFVAREIGPTTIAVLVVSLSVLWLVARPPGEPIGSYLGQRLGAESILLLSIGLVAVGGAHLIDTGIESRLTTQRVLTTAAGDVSRLSVAPAHVRTRETSASSAR